MIFPVYTMLPMIVLLSMIISTLSSGSLGENSLHIVEEIKDQSLDLPQAHGMNICSKCGKDLFRNSKDYVVMNDNTHSYHGKCYPKITKKEQENHATSSNHVVINVADGTELSSKNEVNEAKCPICHSEFDFPIVVLECKHQFCIRCMELWCTKQNTCPICRGLTKFDGVERSKQPQVFRSWFPLRTNNWALHDAVVLIVVLLAALIIFLVVFRPHHHH